MDTTSNDTRSLAELLDPGDTLMVGTPGEADGNWEFRPLTVARVSGSTVEILIDTTHAWATNLAPGGAVHAVLSDNRSNDWSHLQGTSSISRDPELIDELWSPFASAYFPDGRESDGIAVLRVTVTCGRYWSTPSGRIGSLVSVVSAALGSERTTGDQGSVTT